MTDESDEASTAPQGPFNPDRRRDRRVDLGTTVHVTLEDAEAPHASGLSESAEFTVRGQGRDISVGGMYLVTDVRLPAGSTVQVAFDVPEIDETFDLSAEVRWVRRQATAGSEEQWGVGLKFDGMDAQRRVKLDDVVLEHLSEQ